MSHTCLSVSRASTVAIFCPSGWVSMMGIVMRSLIQWGQFRLRLTCTFTVTTLALAGWPLSAARTRIYKVQVTLQTTDPPQTNIHSPSTVTQIDINHPHQQTIHRPPSTAHPWGQTDLKNTQQQTIHIPH